MSIKLITGKHPEFFYCDSTTKTELIHVKNFVSELLVLMNVKGCENNLVRAAQQMTYYSNNKLFIKCAGGR